MTPINFHKKESPLTSLVSLGGGATGSILGGTSDPSTDAIWFTNAESNTDLAALSASVLETLQIRNSSLTETAWEVPAGVTSISIACMGCGGGGMNYPSPASAQGSTSRGGGQLVWRNNITVTPGSTLYVKSSLDGVTPRADNNSNYVTDEQRNEAAFTDSAITDYGRSSWVRIWDGGVNKWLCFAGGAQGKFDDTTGGGTGGIGVMVSSIYGTLGSSGTDYNSGNGGSGGGTGNSPNNYQAHPRGSGGAGGYSGNGGNGSGSQSGDGTAGSGGGAGGAGSYHVYNNFTYNGTYPGYAYGGSTYMWGTGDSGAKGNFTFNRPGDGSRTGTAYSGTIPYGLGCGGGGAKDGWQHVNSKGPTFHGWVRIVWSKDGTTRTFPSTNITYPG